MPRSVNRSRSRSASVGRKRRSPTRSRSGSPRRSMQNRHSRSRSRSGSPRRGGAERDHPKPCKTLGVFGLNYSTSSRDLERHFSRYGRVEKVDLIIDNQGRSRGFGFITFDVVEDARKARSAMTNREFQGRRIRVDYSISKGPHGRTPGQYMGSRQSPSPRRRHSRSPHRRYSRSPSPRRRRYSRSMSPGGRD